MKLLLLSAILVFPSVSLVKVFTFKLPSSGADKASLSRALLENVPQEKLPRQLTVCSSHLQGRVSQNTKTVFVIYQVQAGPAQSIRLLMADNIIIMLKLH